jgi:hypothetical protein
MQNEYCLLISGLDWNEAHAWTTRRFTYRLCVCRVGLIPFYVGFDILRRNEPNVVSQNDRLPSPVMSA